MGPLEPETLVIQKEEEGERLDKILASRYLDRFSRTYFQYLIEEHLVLLNGSPVKKRERPSAGDEVEVLFSATPQVALAAENIPLNIIYEDAHLIVINKPAGMVVHPAPGNWTGTLVNALLWHCKEVEIPGDTLRPGIVHRLDKDTSGLLVAAKSILVQQKLVELFSGRHIYKEYAAICVGNPGKGEISAPIARHPVHRQKMAIAHEGGKHSLTYFETLKANAHISFVKVVLATGRTHQIRVHMQHIGTPILGDAIYGNISMNKKWGAERQMLHAASLKFTHPITLEALHFSASIPKDMQLFLDKL